MGLTCTFFGHHNCPATVKPKLRAVLVELIERQGVDTFYVGRQGAFDILVRSVLREMTEIYPHITYSVVLERLPPCRPGEDYSDTIFPEGMEHAIPRFAISKRNEWMLKQADVVVTYITHDWGGATRYAEKGERQGKAVINLTQKY